jgi:putative sigma-54 modulation protein
MTSPETKSSGDKLILQGIHLHLTEAMKAMITAKAEKLLRHEPNIVRIRIDIEPHHNAGHKTFEAKGHIEIGGPDRHVTVTSDDAYQAVDELIDKLDRQLRKRSTEYRSRRAADDIRSHPEQG